MITMDLMQIVAFKRAITVTLKLIYFSKFSTKEKEIQILTGALLIEYMLVLIFVNTLVVVIFVALLITLFHTIEYITTIGIDLHSGFS
jgi:hypothetical protein